MEIEAESMKGKLQEKEKWRMKWREKQPNKGSEAEGVKMKRNKSKGDKKRERAGQEED